MDFVLSVLKYDHDRYIFISDQSISWSKFHHFSSEVYSGYKSVEKQYDTFMKYSLVFRIRNVEFSNESLVDVIARPCNEYLLFQEKIYLITTLISIRFIRLRHFPEFISDP